MRLFTLCAYLKTRNPMIGGLQGEFGDLDIKYLKQNISKSRSKILGSFKRTPWHYAKWRLGRQYYQSLLFYCGWKWIRRIASVWRAKLSGESELSAADALRVSAIRGSGHVWPGKLKRPPLPSGVRRRMWYIRRRWNISRIEFLPGWNELCHASQGGPSTDYYSKSAIW